MCLQYYLIHIYGIFSSMITEAIYTHVCLFAFAYSCTLATLFLLPLMREVERKGKVWRSQGRRSPQKHPPPSKADYWGSCVVLWVVLCGPVRLCVPAPPHTRPYLQLHSLLPISVLSFPLVNPAFLTPSRPSATPNVIILMLLTSSCPYAYIP